MHPAVCSQQDILPIHILNASATCPTGRKKSLRHKPSKRSRSRRCFHTTIWPSCKLSPAMTGALPSDALLRTPERLPPMDRQVVQRCVVLDFTCIPKVVNGSLRRRPGSVTESVNSNDQLWLSWILSILQHPRNVPLSSRLVCRQDLVSKSCFAILLLTKHAIEDQSSLDLRDWMLGRDTACGDFGEF